MADTNDNPLRIAIHGAAGRMGQRLIALTRENPTLALAEAVDRAGHPEEGLHLPSGITIRDELEGSADVVIDFSTPEATAALIDACVTRKIALVIGTTGLSPATDRAITEAGNSIPILWASNFSLVVNVLNVLAAKAAQLLGPDYDCEILEAHHRFKKDAPSGTALTLAKAICDATDRSFDDDVVRTRAGDDVPRRPGEITVQSLRIGDHVGEHTAYFAALGERLELRHVSTSRDSYVRGALHAAKWLAGKPAGRYSMAQVLGLG